MKKKSFASIKECTTAMPSAIPRRALLALLGCAALPIRAQPAGRLYDPEPPADSGYVRVMSLASAATFSVTINGKPRVSSLPRLKVSDYLVVPAGKHQIELMAAGKVVASAVLDIARSTATTVVIPSGPTPAHVFIDKTGTNRLKSMLSIYQLAEKNETLDITTGDGSIKVFSNLAYGTVGAIQVNPISVDLVAVKAGTSVALARASLSMTQGGAYSIFLLPASGRSIDAIVTQNTTERYTGR